MNQILVRQILPMAIYFGAGHKDNGRFGEILPLEGKQMPPGTSAMFIERQPDGSKKQIKGTIMPWRMQGDNVAWHEPGSQVIEIGF